MSMLLSPYWLKSYDPPSGTLFFDDFNRADNTDFGLYWDTPFNTNVQILNQQVFMTVPGSSTGTYGAWVTSGFPCTPTGVFLEADVPSGYNGRTSIILADEKGPSNGVPAVPHLIAKGDIQDAPSTPDLIRLTTNYGGAEVIDVQEGAGSPWAIPSKMRIEAYDSGSDTVILMRYGTLGTDISTNPPKYTRTISGKNLPNEVFVGFTISDFFDGDLTMDNFHLGTL